MRRLRLMPARVPAGSNRVYAWWRIGVTSARERWCFSCEETIPAGKHHARDDNGRRLCQPCVEASDVNGEQTPQELNRLQRADKIERAGRETVRFLLDGLEVGSIQELKRLVDSTRTAEARYMHERGGVQATAIGLARLALVRGDTAKAADVLDDACDKLHRLHWDACLADGHPPERIEMLLGPRDQTVTRINGRT